MGLYQLTPIFMPADFITNKEDSKSYIEIEQKRKAILTEKEHKIPRSLKARGLREQAIEDQLWKARKVSQTFAKKTGMRFDELFLEASACLVRLYDSWNLDKGANFSTYVNRSLYFLMCNYVRDFGHMHKIPRKMSVDNLKLNKARRENPEASVEELAKILDFKPDYISDLNNCFQTSLSLDFDNDEDNY